VNENDIGQNIDHGVLRQRSNQSVLGIIFAEDQKKYSTMPT